MPIEQENVVNIVCDNPNCPGNELDPADRKGWLFVTSEVYGDPTVQHVFCSVDCVSAATRSTPELFLAPAGDGA